MNLKKILFCVAQGGEVNQSNLFFGNFFHVVGKKRLKMAIMEIKAVANFGDQSLCTLI